MANPQPEQFTKISNELLESFVFYKFNGSQYSLILTILRFTYGFNRKSHSFSLTFLSQATGMEKNHVKQELDKLIKLRIVLVIKEATAKESREIGLNKDYDQWKVESRKKSTAITVPSGNYSTVPQLPDSTVPQLQYQEININKYINKAIEIQSNCENFLKTYNPSHIQEIMSYVDKGLEAELINEIIKDAAKSADRSPLGLCKKMLDRCVNDKIYTLEQYIEKSKSFNESRKPKVKNNISEDWKDF